MDDLDKMAREILAAEYKRVGGRDMAVKTLAGQCDEGASMRAARAALLTAPPGYALVPEVSKTTAALIDLLVARDKAGRAKYGATLDRTDLSHGEWLQHMAEELLDGAGYALAAKRCHGQEVGND